MYICNVALLYEEKYEIILWNFTIWYPESTLTSSLQYRNQCLLVSLNNFLWLLPRMINRRNCYLILPLHPLSWCTNPGTTWRLQLCRVVVECTKQDQRQKTLGLCHRNKGYTKRPEIWGIWNMGRWKLLGQVLASGFYYQRNQIPLHSLGYGKGNLGNREGDVFGKPRCIKSISIVSWGNLYSTKWWICYYLL